MTSRPTFNLRLRAYTPLGDPGRIIPDLGLTVVSSPDGPTLTATVSTVIYGSLPDDLEVAVEVWSDSAGAWQEGRDCRFVILGQQGDDRDATGLVTVTGMGLMQWLAGKAVMAGVVPYQDAGNVEAAASSTTVHVSGTTFTWGSHILGVGDRVRVKAAGGAKNLSSGAVYYVRNPGISTFQLSHTPTGAIKKFGSSTKVSMERVRARIVNLNGHKFAKNMAVSVVDANASNLTDGSQYYVVNPTASTIQVASKPGGIPIEFAVGDALTVYRYLDGARQFKNQTPGQIIGDCFLEARDRGWGQDASGDDQVFHSWTNAGDSNSLKWPARVDDPTIAGVSVGFQPGTSLWDQIRFMLDNGWAEFASQGRTLHLFAPNTGTDYGSTANPRRIGTVAQQVQITKDLSDYRTSEIVRGEGPVEKTVTGGRSPWGRLEAYTTASGVSSAKHATSYGRHDLSTYSKASIGYQVTEAAQEAAYLPIFDFQRGDWVMVQVKGTWTRLRVTQWTLQKNTDGTATVTVLLEAKKRSILHKVAKASQKANGGRASNATSTTPTESDKRKAAKPSAVKVTARTVHAADKSTKSTVTATWQPVTTDEDGDDLTGAGYEVIVRTEGEQVGKAVATTKGNSADLAGYSAGQTIAVAVRAHSSTGEWGELTDEVEYVVDGVENAPQSPTTPVVVSTLGSVTASWDGLLLDPLEGPEPPAAGFAYLTVQRSADNGSTWFTETQTLHAAGTVTDLGLNVGASYSYRFFAVDSLGNQSAPSAVASCSVVGIDVAQINAGFKSSMDQVAAVAQDAQSIANQSAATAGQALNAAGTAGTTASNALTSANGKSKITYSTSAISGHGINQGDLWFQVDASGHITAQWTWDGANWQSNLISGSVITNLDAGAITTGTLDAARISARSISTSQLAVADFTNLFPSPHFDSVGGGYLFSFSNTVSAYSGTDVPIGNALFINGRDHISAYGFPVKAGDSFYLEATVKQVSGTAAIHPSLWLTKAGGGDAGGSPWYSYSVLPLTSSAGAVDAPAPGWTRYGYKLTIPASWTGVAYASLYFQIDQAPTAGGSSWAVSDVLVRRAANARLIVDGSITAGSIAAGAIDGMVITGGTIRTASTAQTSGGVILDPTGITGYNSTGSATFRVDNSGNVSMTGAVHATSGSIDGALIVAGGLYSQSSYPRGRLDSTGIAYETSSTANVKLDQGSYGMGLVWNFSSTSWASLGMTSQNGEWSMAGTLTLDATHTRATSVYNDSVSTRAVYVNSSGTLGTTSSSRRTKNLHSHVRMDDAALDVWLKLPTWRFDYKADPTGAVQYGMVAEEVHDAGLTHLVYYDEREGETKGRIDGLAYEKMPVMNRMAMSRLYERLVAAEKKIALLEAPA